MGSKTQALFLTFALAFSAQAANDLIPLRAGNGSLCLGYPVAVPAGEQDVVIVPSACAEQAILELTGGTIGRTTGVLSSDAKVGLTALKFQSGSVQKISKKAAAKSAAPGSPVLDASGNLMGVALECKSASVADCKVLNFDSAPAKAFFAELKESLWGTDQVALAGNGHEKCRLFGRRHFGGGGGFYYRPVRYSSVSVSISVVQIVQVVQVNNIVINNYNSNNNNTYDSNNNNTSYASNDSSSDEQVAYTPPPPPPRPAYVGVYDPNGRPGDFALTAKAASEVSTSSRQMIAARKPQESQIAQALPDSSLDISRSQMYASNLKRETYQGAGQFAARRVTGKPTLLAGKK